jgi:hypothetical protein
MQALDSNGFCSGVDAVVSATVSAAIAELLWSGSTAGPWSGVAARSKTGVVR